MSYINLYNSVLFFKYLLNFSSSSWFHTMFFSFVGSQGLQERRPGSGQAVYGNYESGGQQHSGLNYPSTSVGGGSSSLGASMAQTPPSAVVSASGGVLTRISKPSATTSSSSSPQAVWVQRHLAQVYEGQTHKILK